LLTVPPDVQDNPSCFYFQSSVEWCCPRDWRILRGSFPCGRFLNLVEYPPQIFFLPSCAQTVPICSGPLECIPLLLMGQQSDRSQDFSFSLIILKKRLLFSPLSTLEKRILPFSLSFFVLIGLRFWRDWIFLVHFLRSRWEDWFLFSLGLFNRGRLTTRGLSEPGGSRPSIVCPGSLLFALVKSGPMFIFPYLKTFFPFSCSPFLLFLSSPPEAFKGADDVDPSRLAVRFPLPFHDS